MWMRFEAIELVPAGPPLDYFLLLAQEHLEQPVVVRGQTSYLDMIKAGYQFDDASLDLIAEQCGISVERKGPYEFIAEGYVAQVTLANGSNWRHTSDSKQVAVARCAVKQLLGPTQLHIPTEIVDKAYEDWRTELTINIGRRVIQGKTAYLLARMSTLEGMVHMSKIFAQQSGAAKLYIDRYCKEMDELTSTQSIYDTWLGNQVYPDYLTEAQEFAAKWGASLDGIATALDMSAWERHLAALRGSLKNGQGGKTIAMFDSLSMLDHGAPPDPLPARLANRLIGVDPGRRGYTLVITTPNGTEYMGIGYGELPSLTAREGAGRSNVGSVTFTESIERGTELHEKFQAFFDDFEKSESPDIIVVGGGQRVGRSLRLQSLLPEQMAPSSFLEQTESYGRPIGEDPYHNIRRGSRWNSRQEKQGGRMIKLKKRKAAKAARKATKRNK